MEAWSEVSREIKDSRIMCRVFEYKESLWVIVYRMGFNNLTLRSFDQYILIIG